MKNPARWAVAALAVTLLTACGDGEGEPEAAGSDALRPVEAPSDWQTQETGPVSVSLPSAWTAAPAPTAEGEGQQAWAFVDEAPEDGGNTNGVTIVAGPAQESDMLTQTENSLTTAERTLGAEDGSSEAHTWPGASDAAYSGYAATMPVGSEDGEKIRFESLGVATEAGQQAYVLVYGPDASYDEDQVHEILASVTVP